mmetsp:Transcript_59798/g.122693  ORF Transcript_59798/g.122693 Transcript_59798/m.122693 type:complete len:409 (-) Transcript_59798:2136-3362(-)
MWLDEGLRLDARRYGSQVRYCNHHCARANCGFGASAGARSNATVRRFERAVRVHWVSDSSAEDMFSSGDDAPLLHFGTSRESSPVEEVDEVRPFRPEGGAETPPLEGSEGGDNAADDEGECQARHMAWSQESNEEDERLEQHSGDRRESTSAEERTQEADDQSPRERRAGNLEGRVAQGGDSAADKAAERQARHMAWLRELNEEDECYDRCSEAWERHCIETIPTSVRRWHWHDLRRFVDACMAGWLTRREQREIADLTWPPRPIECTYEELRRNSTPTTKGNWGIEMRYPTRRTLPLLARGGQATRMLLWCLTPTRHLGNGDVRRERGQGGNDANRRTQQRRESVPNDEISICGSWRREIDERRLRSGEKRRERNEKHADDRRRRRTRCWVAITLKVRHAHKRSMTA